MNYLIAEQVLQAELAKVAGIRKVYTTEELAGVKKQNQFSPCIHIVYGGDKVPEGAQGGALARVKQTWLVFLAVKLGKGESTGELLDQTIKTVMGLSQPGNGLGPFRRVNTPMKPSFHDGFGYYPVAFETTFTQRSNS